MISSSVMQMGTSIFPNCCLITVDHHYKKMMKSHLYDESSSLHKDIVSNKFFEDIKENEDGSIGVDYRKSCLLVTRRSAMVTSSAFWFSVLGFSRDALAVKQGLLAGRIPGLSEPDEKGNEWWDLCAGPHVDRTGNIKKNAIELESVAGAYWRGDEKKPMLQRIYGTAWETEEQLKAYRHLKVEAKRRDHRRLGQDLDLFSIQEDAGGGLVFWHPKGALVRHLIEDSWKKIHIQRGYDLLYTPHVAKADLWKISGHLDFYKENMFDQMKIEDELYQLRPMNCPYHILVYKRRLHSYRDFPIRVAELGTVYRYELSGSLHGLFRVRGFTQDDAHIFCLDHQIKDEIRGVLDLTEEILFQFGFRKYEVNLSTRPEKAVGSDDIWEKATAALQDALDSKGWDYQIDEGGGAFYGPKIDLKIEDALGRKWQCSTVQVDFNLPQRFDIFYIDSNSEKKRPIMIHRAVLGSLERFFGVLIEHYAGDFPLWISPIQTRVLPVTDTEVNYCSEVLARLKAKGIRAEMCHGERLPKLIRNAEKQKVPLMAVVGPKEVESQTVTVRSRSGGELGTMSLDDFIHKIHFAVENRTLL